MALTGFSEASTSQTTASGGSPSGARNGANPRGRGGGNARRKRDIGGGRNRLIRRIENDTSMSDASAGAGRGGKRRSTASDLRPGSAPGRNRAQDRANQLLPARVRGVAVRGSANKRKEQAALSGRIQTLRNFLRSRWDEPNKALLLENMASDPILHEAKIIPPGAPGASANLSSAIFKLIKDMYPDIKTLSLASNNFKTLAPIATLPEYLPKLSALSLQSNDIKWTKDLYFGSKKSLSSLTELVLVGNPVQQNTEAAGNESGYRKEVVAKFPSLTLLDFKPIERTEAQQAVSSLPSAKKNTSATSAAAVHFSEVTPVQIPLSTQASFVFPPMDADSTVSTFLDKFMNTTDTNVEELRPAYDAEAIFSFMYVHPVPPRARAAGFFNSMKHQKALRNDLLNELQQHDIMRLGAHSPTRGIHLGPDSIIKFFRRLPRTRHPTTDPSKFVFDAWTIPSSRPQLAGAGEDPLVDYFINVHGEFTEVTSGGVRSFDRTFLVAPAAPGSPAALAGWPCTILSDELCLRQYSGTESWSIQPAATDPAPVAAAPAPVVTTGSALSPDQQAMVLRLSTETRMNSEFSLMCLSQNNWNYDAAKANFMQLQAANTIPPDAFTT